jgi:hypothetical protein
MGVITQCTSVLNAELSLKRAKKPFGRKAGANFGVCLAVKQCGGVLNARAITKKLLSAKNAKDGALKMNWLMVFVRNVKKKYFIGRVNNGSVI